MGQREKKAMRAKSYKEKVKARQQRMDEEEAQKNKYRDRAKELREGTNTDYQGIGDKIDFEHMDYKTTKYLGGDIKHTHMVKGLDWGLLNVIRKQHAETGESLDAEFQEAANRSKIEQA